MIITISCSELTVETLHNNFKERNGIPFEGSFKGFVSGATVTTKNGYELFSVSGSDEYTATINGVESYVIDEHGIAQVVLQETL
jgi:hypothetical protein